MRKMGSNPAVSTKSILVEAVQGDNFVSESTVMAIDKRGVKVPKTVTTLRAIRGGWPSPSLCLSEDPRFKSVIARQFDVV